jgi:Tol biopolymer transport system component
MTRPTIPTPTILTQLTNPKFLDGRPCFSPDGTTVLFMRQPINAQGRAGRSSLWQVPLASPGTGKAFHANSAYSLTRSDWSWANGNNSIAFTPTDGTRLSNTFGLLQVESNTKAGTVTLVSVAGHGGNMKLAYPSWCPGGRDLALTNYANNQLIKVNSKGVFAQTLTDTNQIWAGMCSVNQVDDSLFCMAAQAPAKSNTLGAPEMQPGYKQKDNRIYTQDGKNAPQLFSASSNIGRAPWWSPNGKYVAYEANGANGVYQIFIQASNQPASSALPVTNSTLPVQHAKWSPNGKILVLAVACEQPQKKKAVPWRIEAIDISAFVRDH